MNCTSSGKLSSKGPRTPFGYQMKWPIPSEAKFSPVFQEVSPEIVPPHSFFQIFRPICIASARERLIAMAEWSGSANARATARRQRGCRCLDAFPFSDSVQPSARRLSSSGALFSRFDLMKHTCIGLAAVLVASTALAQQAPQLKDEKDKVSYSIGLDIGTTFKKQN